MTVLAAPATAQEAVPEFRFVATQGVDFYGSDLEPLFDSDLDSCVRACAAQKACAAFTFNRRSNACFPKSAVSRKTPYDGAVSAIKMLTEPSVLSGAADRRGSLGFLSGADLTQAAANARDLGLRHPAGSDAELDLDSVLSAAQARRDSGDRVQAMAWTGLAVSLSDRADLWVDYARQLLGIEAKNSTAKRDFAERARSAAINGYLRADTVADRAAALGALAEALERTGQGAVAIPALRLAQGLLPGAEIDRALDRVIGMFGFRIVDSTVESDSAAPRICAEFSSPLVPAGVDYDTFVRLPDPALVVQPEGSQLCVDGVRHGERYRVTFRAGLPAADGELLQKDVELTHYVRDRSPGLRFPGRSYVLPKSADSALPIETVNLGTVDLQLRRISERNLLRAMQDGYFGRPLTQWQDETFAGEIAEDIWSGTAEVANTLNRDMTTRLPMGAAIADQPAGIYALTARVPGADPYDDPGATQWFVLSDLGIATLSGTGGLDVTVRSLSDAAPRANVEVTLVSRANVVLARRVTDADGRTRFDPGLLRGGGGAAPALILAEQGETDAAFLSLSDPAFDLSDRGVEGRAAAGPVDVFLTTERGAYRAGETVHATVLSRTPTAEAIEGLPLIAVLRRPDGVEYTRLVSDGGVMGGHVFSLPVAASAPRGTWRLDILGDPDAPALASQTLLVEDFLPERIDFDLALPDAPIRIGSSPTLRIDARYLFGAPGSDLIIDGQTTLAPAETVAAWPGYRFGRHTARPQPVSEVIGGGRTDAQGQATIAFDLPVPAVSGQPLDLTVTARLADGSARPVERRISAPVQPGTPVIGIKPLFDDVIAEDGTAMFDVVGLAPDLTPMPMPVRWTLNRVETRYQWYQLYGNWNWEPTTRRTRIATGDAMLDGPLTISQPVAWGDYELVVERTEGDYAAASVGFKAGWYGSGDAVETPDRLELSLDRGSYRPGDTARLRIVPNAAGLAEIAVLSDRVIHRETIAVDAGETIIPLTVTEDWGAGAYVSATVIRPMDVAAGQNPARALGLAHAMVEPAGKVLQVAIDVPDVVRPRQEQPVRVTVDGAAQGETVWLSLAAVDLGILNLTGFKSPDPETYYFGQRRLGVEMRDLYGRLIDGMNGALGTVRSGGDNGAGMRMQSPPPTQDLMAAFSGPVQVGPDGTATVNIDLPAFDGTVRLMAVAWSRTAVGQDAADMHVRDPVVVTASLPNFLAPGDESRIRLDVAHADGPAGQMMLELTAAGSSLKPGPAPGAFDLAPEGKATFEVPLAALTAGDARIDMVLTTPDGQDLRQSLTLPVRANDPVVARTRRLTLDAGQELAVTSDIFSDFRAGTGRAILSAGPLAAFDVPGLLSSLNRYPYGCTEQVASQVLPLLYLSSVAQSAGLGDGAAIRAQVEAAITRILTRQAGNGAFGLWRADTGDFWLDAYVSDVLSRARTQGYPVPDRAFRLAMDNLRNRINYAPDFENGGEDIAYALMVLARDGTADIGDLRYYADVKGADFATPLAAAQVGAALAAYGDQTRADAMFARAARMADTATPDPLEWRADYGTALRDAAGVLALATEAGSAAVNAEGLAARITRADAPFSTQESAWSLLAAQALIKNPEAAGLLVDGVPAQGPFVEVIDDDDAMREVRLTAAEGRAVDVTLTTTGVPETPPAAGGTGYAITRSLYTMDGTRIERPDLAVGDRFVTVLQVTAFERSGARLMVNDPLPAGVEIDNPSLLRSGDIRALDWLKPSEAEHVEFRSDRFLAAVDMRAGAPVTLAYVARAVTPGGFHHPAASVEDMYRPAFRARTDSGRLVVTR
ncbi:alpha-2-macroglobulin family protein [Sedimentitalea sp. JM2-8]|uniref:Alpha-2-macroglobulin family protein n=2 Tax=Sedimentitalea xiamensis TaxID=3050037 RepID=A0ABT7F8T4_9RHOB|nr:alpha-2-macroglobulin family protein [Sedimentitalea xiamensis]